MSSHASGCARPGFSRSGGVRRVVVTAVGSGVNPAVTRPSVLGAVNPFGIKEMGLVAVSVTSYSGE